MLINSSKTKKKKKKKKGNPKQAQTIESCEVLFGRQIPSGPAEYCSGAILSYGKREETNRQWKRVNT